MINEGEMKMNLNKGDIVKMKKPHPCGSYLWSIIRAGIDFRIKCEGCGHEVLIPRKKFEKNIKSIESQAE